MAYSKTTWNNLSSPPINAENLNKIEQGIYNNSLGIDIINPSGTATTTAEIEEGQITDVIGFKSLKLKGNTSQYTTTGKNIFPRITFSQTINGVTITATGDGTIKIKGTANSSGVNHPIWGAWGSSTTLFTIPAGTYTASGIGTRQQSPRMNIVTNGTTSIFVTNTTQTLDSDTNVTGIFIWVDAGTTVDTTFKPMIETGSSATSYEPYTGKKASPNPDFPQAVNNVSGYNVVRISNKNLIEYSFKGYNINSQGKFETGGTALDFDVHIAKVKAGTTYTITPATNVIAYFDEKPTITSQAHNNTREVITSTNRLTPTRSGYIAMRTATSNTAQVEKGTSATSFVAHQGNNFEVNLGKNLFNKDDSSLIFNGFANRSSLKLESNASAKTICQPCKPNTTYTISKILSARFFVDETSSPTISNGISITPLSTGSSSNVTSYTVTTSASAKYLLVYYYVSSADTLSEEEIRNTIQIEYGNQATSYASFFPPIELCKIGTFQDYIFKRDGKWFKHKEIGKVVWNGTESWAANPGITTTYVISRPTDLAQANNNVFYNYFSTVADLSTATEGARIGSSINLKNPNTADLASFKTWLGTNNVEMYYQSNTPTDEEITYTPLIKQLDELYNSGLYDNTNISQDNSSEVFILDIEACKNNINGIVEYIRR